MCSEIFELLGGVDCITRAITNLSDCPRLLPACFCWPRWRIKCCRPCCLTIGRKWMERSSIVLWKWEVLKWFSKPWRCSLTTKISSTELAFSSLALLRIFVCAIESERGKPLDRWTSLSTATLTTQSSHLQRDAFLIRCLATERKTLLPACLQAFPPCCWLLDSC